MFYFRQKQLDSLPSITGGSDFVSALNSEKRNINSKKAILKHKSQNYQCEWHLAVYFKFLQKRGFRNPLFISKYDCYFEPLEYVKGGC